MFGFERLGVLMKVADFAEEIYCIMKTCPADQRYEVTSQLHRASVSNSSNIAGGLERPSNPDYSCFLRVAYGSLMKCVSQLHLAQSPGFTCQNKFNSLVTRAEEKARMLSGLLRRLESRDLEDEF